MVVLIPKGTELDLNREKHFLVKGTCIIKGGTVMIVSGSSNPIKIIRLICPYKLRPANYTMILKQATEQ